MHIPDGLIAPQTFIAAGLIAVPLWAHAVRRVACDLDERLIPRMAVLTALAFVLSTVMVPLPGGTSVHLTGVGLLVLVFGLWPAFLAFSLVLALQAVLLGAGGITALPVNALAMGLVGGAVVSGTHGLTGRRKSFWSVLAPVWLGVVVAAVLLAVVLGLQPWLASDDAGQPLFFPFGLQVTLPVIVLPHLAIGLAEGMLSWFVLSALEARRMPA